LESWGPVRKGGRGWIHKFTGKSLFIIIHHLFQRWLIGGGEGYAPCTRENFGDVPLPVKLGGRLPPWKTGGTSPLEALGAQ